MKHISTTTPRSRKAHRCHACALTIRPGEVYQRECWADGGRAWSWAVHAECAVEVARHYDRGEADGDCLTPGAIDDCDLTPDYLAWRERRRLEVTP